MSDKFVLEIELKNAAFRDGDTAQLDAGREIARILKVLASDLERDVYGIVNGWSMRYSLHDVNGNLVGFWRVQADETGA